MLKDNIKKLKEGKNRKSQDNLDNKEKDDKMNKSEKDNNKKGHKIPNRRKTKKEEKTEEKKKKRESFGLPLQEDKVKVLTERKKREKTEKETYIYVSGITVHAKISHRQEFAFLDDFPYVYNLTLKHLYWYKKKNIDI